MVWLKLLVCVAIILFAGTKLAFYGDAIAEKTRLGRLWIGLVLISIVTTMPELVTSVSSAALVDSPDQALGNLFGSCMFNLTTLAVIDVICVAGPVLSQVSPRHALSGGVGIVLLGVAIAGILAADTVFGEAVGWVGIPSFVILVLYLGATWLIFRRERRLHKHPAAPSPGEQYEHISTRTAWVRASLASIAIVGAGIWLAFIGDEIAAATGWGSSFVGSLFLAITTSLPELTLVVAAVRLGAVDMAVANILGANMLDILVITWTDVAYTEDPLLSVVSSSQVITAAVAIAMTLLAIVAIRQRPERKTLKVMNWYAPVLVALYIFGAWASFAQPWT